MNNVPANQNHTINTLAARLSGHTAANYNGRPATSRRAFSFDTCTLVSPPGVNYRRARGASPSPLLADLFLMFLAPVGHNPVALPPATGARPIFKHWKGTGRAVVADTGVATAFTDDGYRTAANARTPQDGLACSVSHIHIIATPVEQERS